MPAMATLRELLAGTEPVLAPGAYDALSARLVERAGFPAVYMTGFGASASLLGQPDVGLLSFAEMADQARRLTEAVDVPLIADADTRAQVLIAIAFALCAGVSTDCLRDLTEEETRAGG